MTNAVALAHIPGPAAPPVVGHTLTVVRDAYGSQQRFIDRYGLVYKTKVLGVWHINLCGADAIEMVLMDRDRLFSSAQGWDAIEQLFAGGLMLQDFEVHRKNRRIMQSAFRAEALQEARTAMWPAMQQLVGALPRHRPFQFYDAVKELTLRIGCSVFLGLELRDPKAALLNKALIDQIKASVSGVRRPLPFSPMRRGLKARGHVHAMLRAMIAQRKGHEGRDFLSAMCRARDDDGRGWDDTALVEQFNFLMMAAHDTTASALTALVWLLGTHPEWQVKIRDEIRALSQDPAGGPRIDQMGQTDMVIKEALRLVPPVPFIPRRALGPFEWQGHDIPAGASITVNPGVTMLSDQLYSRPLRFDPLRFALGRAEDKAHKFAWTPFGGGAHKCIGLHFAMMEIKLFLAALMQHDNIKLAGPCAPRWLRLPIPRPACGLPIVLTPT